MSERAVYTILKDDASIAALTTARIFPLLAPQNVARPFITYRRVSGTRVRSFDGPSGLAQPRIQVDAYGDTYAEVKALATAIRIALDGFSGTVGGIRVGGISLSTDQDLIEEDHDPKLFRVIMDFMVTHSE